MKRLMIMALAAGSLAGQALAGRDISTVRDYVIRAAGKKTLEGIRAKKSGEKFLQTFLNDQDWLEQFAGSGRPGTFCPGPSDTPYAAALEALDLLVWNDAGGFADTRTGRLVLTAIALDHGGRWPAEKMVELAACYRDWVKDGTLHDSAFDLDVWGWREVLCMGQNAELPIEDLRFVHDFAFIPEPRYRGICWAPVPTAAGTASGRRSTGGCTTRPGRISGKRRSCASASAPCAAGFPSSARASRRRTACGRSPPASRDTAPTWSGRGRRSAG